jgi:putative ABC transport system ATP-binding protein
MVNDAAICVRGVSKTYAHGAAAVRALTSIDLDLQCGELTLLMGPSGSGKTTLLSIMGCILRPTEGRVSILGEDVTGLDEHQLPRVRRDWIGFVFQQFNLFPTLTALDNVSLAFDLRGLSRRQARRRAMDILQQLDLGDKLDAFPAELSGGQQQRVAIGRAMAGEPWVILADEPTAALDSRSGHAVMTLLKGLAREQGRAIVIVTHDNRLLDYADRIVQIEDGRVMSDSRTARPAGEGRTRS